MLLSKETGGKWVERESVYTRNVGIKADVRGVSTVAGAPCKCNVIPE